MEKERKEKFGIICRVKIDHDDTEVNRYRETMVYRKDKTPNRPDYRHLMANGGKGWRREHSNNDLLEWGTPTDYLGKGRKLLLFDTDSREITVETDIDPDSCYADKSNYYRVRNIIVDDSLKVLRSPIPLEKVRNVPGLERFQNYRQFKDITKEQYEALMRIIKSK